MDREKKRRIALLRRLAPDIGVRSNVKKLSSRELKARTDAALYNKSLNLEEGAGEDDDKTSNE